MIILPIAKQVFQLDLIFKNMLNLFKELNKIKEQFPIFERENKVCFGGILSTPPFYSEEDNEYSKKVWLTSGGHYIIHITDNNVFIELDMFNKNHVDNILVKKEIGNISHSLNAKYVYGEVGHYKLTYRSRYCNIDIDDSSSDLDTLQALIDNLYKLNETDERSLFSWILYQEWDDEV